MIFHVLTLFPEMFETLNHSILKKAQEKDLIQIHTVNIRDFSENKHKKVDDYPYGGGAGMVMQAQPIYNAYKSLDTKARVIFMTPKGRTFDQALANELSNEEELIFLCGHYEGVDQRIIDLIVTDEVSVGDFVLTGGELPAMIMIDAIARLREGVLGKNVSYEDESHYSGLLEYNHFTRPPVFEDLKVPEILFSGHHQKIDAYRLMESLYLTELRRPDMFKKWCEGPRTKEEKKILKKYLDNNTK
ncbi:MAG: tRNA (guanosine(37)-N1)-methyltransferase TrmD [Clostridia bacterium]|nr:tRNA (guanosine(37)-N1)-methyltransferase TrmD [Clostridia bacterium]